MCFGTFILPTFIRDLGMALYFGGRTKESIKALHIQKKVIRLITGIKKYESYTQKFKENRILSEFNVRFTIFVLHKKV
jgi:hypothetical protein